jgi:PAS domain S-box-containing protein
MRRHSNPGAKLGKAKRGKAGPLQRRNARKATRCPPSSAATRMELRTNEARWRSLLDNPLFGVTFVDESQRFITTNQTFQTMVGYSDDELRLMTPLDISVSGEREINETYFTEMQQGKRQHYEMTKQLRRKDGTLVWVRLYVFAVTDRKSGAKLNFGMVIDITAKKQAEDALQDARAELARAAQLNQMGVMTISITHEISQPISAMVAHANAGIRWLSKTQPDIDETLSSLQEIVSAGQVATDVIEAIRALFRNDTTERTSIDLNTIVRDVLVLAQSERRHNPIEVQTELEQSLPPVTADRAQLRQVMFNLFTNAIDAMESVSGRNHVLRVKSHHNADEGIVVTVEDSGTGVVSENIDRIFETFFTTKAHGMGMGLAISRSIVESHGGKLSVSVGHPCGTVFKVVLPIGT